MEGESILPTIAEVSIAFAGFASLVSIVGQRFLRDQVDLNVMRLRGMLETSLIALLFSLAPFVPTQFGASETVAWRVSSFVFATVSMIRIITALPRARIPGASRALAIAILGTQGAVAILLFAVALGFANDLASAIYLLALFLYLCISAILFLRLALSLLASQKPAV